MASGYDASILYDAAALYDAGDTAAHRQSLYARHEMLGSDALVVAPGGAQLGVTSRKSRLLVALNLIYPPNPAFLWSLVLPADPVAIAVNAGATHFYARSTEALYKVAVGGSSIVATYLLESADQAWMMTLDSGNFILPVQAGVAVISPVGVQVAQGFAVFAQASFAAFNPSTRYLYVLDRKSGTLGIFHLSASDALGAISIANLEGTLGARSMRLSRDGLSLFFVGPDTVKTFTLADPEAPEFSTAVRHSGYSLTDFADIDGGFQYVGAEIPIPDQLPNYDLPYGQDVVIYSPEVTAMLALNSDEGRLLVWAP